MLWFFLQNKKVGYGSSTFGTSGSGSDFFKTGTTGLDPDPVNSTNVLYRKLPYTLFNNYDTLKCETDIMIPNKISNTLRVQ